MAGIARKITGLMRKRFRPRVTVTINDTGDLIEQCHWTERARVRMDVPVGMLRMQGAFVYGEDHPFVRALSEGRVALESFYNDVRPGSIAEYYGLVGGGRTGADLPPWEVPWYLRKERTPPPGELELGPEHGVSFYGPATADKIRLEMSRLQALRKNIGSKGYDPDRYGDIEGYVLRDGAYACFFVRGGKHRAAALASLGYERIPVAFRQSFPRIVDTAQADYWPLVRAGVIDKTLAQEILRAYTRASTKRGMMT